MPPAVRLSDKAAIPADKHGCPACPHPGFGPAVNGSPNVFINKKPAIRLGDPGVHMACCGANQWKTDKGSSTVYVNNKPLVRMGDKTKHCGGDGKMIMGSPNVFADDGGAGAGALKKLLMKLLEAGRALLEKWKAKNDKKAGSWAGKGAKGKGGKGKGGKGGKGKDGKAGKAGKAGKNGKGGKGGGGADGGADGAGGSSVDPANQDLSSDVGGSESTAGEGIIRIGLVRPTIKPGQECQFVVECRSATTGSIKVKAVLVDAEGKEVVTTKETSVDAKLEARGSLIFENLDSSMDGAFETPEKAQKWIEDTLGHPAGSRRFKFLLRASHDTGDKDSPDATCDLDAVTGEVLIHLFEEAAEPDADEKAEPTNQRKKTRVPGTTWASVKLEGHPSPFRVKFVDGRGSIPEVVIPAAAAGEGQEDPRVLSIEFDNKKFQKYAWKAFVPEADVKGG